MGDRQGREKDAIVLRLTTGYCSAELDRVLDRGGKVSDSDVQMEHYLLLA